MIVYAAIELDVPDGSDRPSLERAVRQALEESPTFNNFGIRAELSTLRIPERPRLGWWERRPQG